MNLLFVAMPVIRLKRYQNFSFPTCLHFSHGTGVANRELTLLRQLYHGAYGESHQAADDHKGEEEGEACRYCVVLRIEETKERRVWSL